MGTIENALATGLVAIGLTACASSGAEREPAVIEVQQSPYWGQTEAAYGPPKTEASASIWTTAPNALLGMRRAKDVGDLLTVVVNMNDQASLQTSLSRNRSTNENRDTWAMKNRTIPASTNTGRRLVGLRAAVLSSE